MSPSSDRNPGDSPPESVENAPQDATSPIRGPRREPNVPPPPVEQGIGLRAAVQVPGYEIIGILGRGGMGVVYKAVQIGLKRVVALKMILGSDHAGEASRARFRAEAEAVARLQHPHIVQIHEIGQHNGQPFFSLEYCPGGSLSSRLGGKPLPSKEAARLVQTLAEAVHVAHKAGALHRDLKPANILLTRDGKETTDWGSPKVADFGLAKRLDDNAHLTQSGAIVGTPSYMAPEQATSNRDLIGPGVDIYSLGAVLYELLTGKPPFEAETPLETVFQVLEIEATPVRKLNREVSLELEAICSKCLRKRPEARYASAADLAADLGRFLRGEPISIPTESAWGRRARWLRRKLQGIADRWLTVGVLGACILVIALTVILGSGPNKTFVEVLPNLASILPVLAVLVLGLFVMGWVKGSRKEARPGASPQPLPPLPRPISVATIPQRQAAHPVARSFDQIFREVQAELARIFLDSSIAKLNHQSHRPELRLIAERLVDREHPLLNRMEREALIDGLMDETLGYGPLDVLIREPAVEEIRIAAPRQIQVRIRGELVSAEVHFRDANHLQSIIDRMQLRRVGRGQAHLSEGLLPEGFHFQIIPSPLPDQPPLVHLRRDGSGGPTSMPSLEDSATGEPARPMPSQRVRQILVRLVRSIHDSGFESLEMIDQLSIRRVATQITREFFREREAPIGEKEEDEVVEQVLSGLTR